LSPLQHPDEHRSERPVLLAIDQKLGEVQLGAGGRPEGVEARP
jgi:hypothetical protein